MNVLKLSPHHPARKAIGVLIVGLLATVLAQGLRLPVLGDLRERADDLLYDAFYRLRALESPPDPTVAVLAMDDIDLKNMNVIEGRGHPWPRTFWGVLVHYLAKGGVRAVALDVQFSERSSYDASEPDDETFVTLMESAPIPVIFGVKFDDMGKPEPIWAFRDRQTPRIGSVEIERGPVLREYRPRMRGLDALATATLRALSVQPPSWAEEPFRLHFYGATSRSGGRAGLPYLRAFPIVFDAISEMKRAAGVETTQTAEQAEEAARMLAKLKGKVVVVGSMAAGTFDLFSSPVSELYPGVDSHATAIENMLRGQRVVEVSQGFSTGFTLMAALLAAAATIFPFTIGGRLAGAVVAPAAVVAAGLWLFLGDQIDWMPITTPLAAVLLATVGGFARNFLTEDARRRLMARALGQYVSPEITRALERRPESLKLDAEQRTMTALFSDMAGFTDFSEAAEVRVLTKVLNAYMERMSAIVLAEGGTIDKYIGDAIMAFWNAPLDQPDHAARACRAALRMQAAERSVRDELLADPELAALLARDEGVRKSVEAMGEGKLYTRFGINTGLMAVGNWGSARKFQYTVIGDSVNSAARLEPANKRYGTRILISESTATLLPAGSFLLRRVDVTRVKGKANAMAVFELMAEGGGSAEQRAKAAMYEQAFGLYQQQRWEEVEKTALALQAQFGEDGPSVMLLERSARLRREPPGPGWDGVFTATDK